MSENQIGFLFKAATILSKDKSNKTKNILASYYLMKCKEITRGYGLPQKQFSEDARCPQCCTEWHNDVETRVTSLKHSKQQKRRLKHRQKKLNRFQSKKSVLDRIKLEKICGFCNHITSSSTSKPNKQISDNNEKSVKINKDKKNVKRDIIITPKSETSNITHVYCNSKDAFSLTNKDNTLSSIVKEKPKIVNSKKKKDRFAGLCQKAVLAANKMNQKTIKTNLKTIKTNKIDLFLRPSS